MVASQGAADAKHPLLAHLAAAVRARRKARAMTLRELAAAASVSERFLGLVESGSGNVSVVKLDDIARALGTTAAALLAEGGAAEGAHEAGARGAIVALLGLRGAGKSAIGARVAHALGLPFLELDALVAERAGMSLGELFELHGADYYRKLERAEVERLVADGASCVLATGGGLVTDHGTYALLRGAATTVWLRAKPEHHLARVVAQGDARPMRGRDDAMRELEALLRARRPLYEQADHVVDTSAIGLERAASRVLRIAREACDKGRARGA